LLIGVGGVDGNVLRFQPPLVIAEAQIDRALDIMAEALQEVAPA
jgi:4-aminobutyrate aminotransferase-like enzyme